MRRSVAVLASLMILSGLLFVEPAAATHGCTAANCNPVTIALLEGQGYVCDSAEESIDTCTYHNDRLWTGAPPAVGASSPKGLYCPTRGPGADGPFSFQAGPVAADPPNSICVSTVGGPGCTFKSKGWLEAGQPSGLGAYAGSSKGTGTSEYIPGANAALGSTYTKATFGWEQSAATILPLNGKVTHQKTSAGASYTPVPANAVPTVTGFTSSRGFTGGGNCGIDQTTPTWKFQVEGMVVTF